MKRRASLRAPRLADADLDAPPLDKRNAEARIEVLQERIFGLQVRYFLEGRRAIFVFEGWDAAGKGGAIRRLTGRLDPRGYKVWPISAPRDGEAEQHYLWRFWTRLPPRGTLAVFDRSWYGRVLVERVERLAPPAAWRRAYGEINDFERLLGDDGILVRKFFLHIDKRTQLERFRARAKDPIRLYKLGPEDWRNRRKWPAYEEAIDDMFSKTHRPNAPWILVPANDKRRARLYVLEQCCTALEEGLRR